MSVTDRARVTVSAGLAAALLVSSCSGPQEPAVAEPAANETAAQESVFDPMVDTIERAEGVEDLNAERKGRLDDAIEGQ